MQYFFTVDSQKDHKNPNNSKYYTSIYIDLITHHFNQTVVIERREKFANGIRRTSKQNAIIYCSKPITTSLLQ